MSQTQLPPTEGDEAQAEPEDEQESPTIGAILKSLRGKRSLRQVHAETGVPYTYLSSIELGQKNPGMKTLSRLAECYEVPVQDLMAASGIRVIWDNQSGSTESLQFALKALKDGNYRNMTIERYYDFVMSDPDLSGCRKPEETPSADIQRFIVEMYEHYTGKKLI